MPGAAAGGPVDKPAAPAAENLAPDSAVRDAGGKPVQLASAWQRGPADAQGTIVFRYVGSDKSDRPELDEVLATLRHLRDP